MEIKILIIDWDGKYNRSAIDTFRNQFRLFENRPVLLKIRNKFELDFYEGQTSSFLAGILEKYWAQEKKSHPSRNRVALM